MGWTSRSKNHSLQPSSIRIELRAEIKLEGHQISHILPYSCIWNEREAHTLFTGSTKVKTWDPMDTAEVSSSSQCHQRTWFWSILMDVSWLASNQGQQDQLVHVLIQHRPKDCVSRMIVICQPDEEVRPSPLCLLLICPCDSSGIISLRANTRGS